MSLLGFTQGVCRRRDRGLRAVGDTVEVCGQPRGHREVQLTEVLVAVFAI